jgi:hypothetical protein
MSRNGRGLSPRANELVRCLYPTINYCYLCLVFVISICFWWMGNTVLEGDAAEGADSGNVCFGICGVHAGIKESN